MTMRTLTKLLLIAVTVFSVQLATAASTPRNFQTIIDSGELRVGVAIFPPWVMRAKDGELVGSEIDMSRRLAADMGLSPRLSLFEWEQLIPALQKGEIDIIISGMGINPERALLVNFSQPYGDAGIGLAANKLKTADFARLDDMKQPKVVIGAIRDTVSAGVAKRMFSRTTLKYFSSQEASELALLKGEIHALVAANPAPRFLALKYPEKVDTPLTKPLMSFKEGLAIRKGDIDLLNFLNAWVVSRTADAWIPSTRHYWLESLEWKEQVP